MLRFNLVSIFPEFFCSPLQVGLLAKAEAENLVSFSFYNPRDFSLAPHAHVDDRPFGGGPGMVMTLQPIISALQAIENPGKILMMSAAGKELTGQLARQFSFERNITIICGRYEGIDARLADFANIQEIRLGRAILNGGETAALATIEAVCRFLPGFMGKEQSTEEESFSNGLLEYPQYTRPAIYDDRAVPEILLQGNHAKIARWRKEEALKKTLQSEPESLARAELSLQDVNFLKNLARRRIGRNLSFCLLHYPVKVEKNRPGVSSLTNLDIHDISRVSKSYGMGPFFVLTPLQKQLDLLKKILSHWLAGPASKSNPDRREALKLVVPAHDFDELAIKAAEHYGAQPKFVMTSAEWPGKGSGYSINCHELRELLKRQPVVLCLGTANGIAVEALDLDFTRLAPIRFLDDNHLSVRGAAAILADRIIGDFY